MKKAALAALCLALAALAGCATLGPRRAERVSERIIGLVNSGQAEQLAAMSRIPFLLDGEILLLDGDVSAFWKSALQSGFRIDPAAAVTAAPLGPESYKQFGSTMDVRTFFQKYAPGKGSLVTLQAGRTRFLLLLEPGKLGRTLIIGFKGPEAI